jgi:RNA polymerase-binding transcription factor DksA
LNGLLTQRHNQLTSIVQRELHADGALESSITGDIDADPSVADVAADLSVARAERDTHELAAIQQALERIRSGSYGNCATCSAHIDYQRLLAHPAAERCFACQKQHET